MITGCHRDTEIRDRRLYNQPANIVRSIVFPFGFFITYKEFKQFSCTDYLFLFNKISTYYYYFTNFSLFAFVLLNKNNLQLSEP